MYDSFYNLAEKPFKINTDPRFLWCGEKHGEALANLKYGLMDHNGFVVLSGDIGTGKTTLVNALLESLDENVRVAKINHPNLDTFEFLTLVAKTFDPSITIADKSDLVLFFNSFLQKTHAEDKVALLIIDEAHRLSLKLLEEIRLLSNIEQAGKRLLNIILVGQNELKPMLLSPQCRALRQRITLFYDLQALSREETLLYVEYRLKVSGLQEMLFTKAALHKVHALSQGNPRRINILCDRALLTGYVKERRTIDVDIILECDLEMNLRDQAKEKIHRVFVSEVITDGRIRFRQLVARTITVKQILKRAAKRISEVRKAAVARIYSRAKTFSFGIIDITGPFIKKYQRKIITSVLAAGIAFISLALTIGAYRADGVKKGQSVSEIQPKMPSRSASAATGQPANGGAPSERATPAASTQATASQSSVHDSNREASAANPEPLPGNRNIAPTETSAEPGPTALELAAAALDSKNYQKALELLGSHQSSATGENLQTAGLYAKALVGRAGEIIATSPLEAETMLRNAIDVAPGNADAFSMLGKYYTRTKDYAQAIDAYQTAVHLDPALPDAFFNLGFIYATTERYDAAEKAFARAVQLTPPYLEKALFNLAVVQQKLGHKEESIANLEEALSLEPENEKALAYLNQLRKSAAGNIAEQIR